jgi:single-strand DNA-binding protein
MNNFVGIGRLTRGPNVKYTQSGKACTNFTLAIDRRRSGDGNQLNLM